MRGDEIVAARQGHCFEARVDSKRVQQMPNVIPDRLRAEVQFPSDLLGGIAAREQTQNLGLTRGQVRWDRMFLGGLSDIGKLAEDTDASVELRSRA